MSVIRIGTYNLFRGGEERWSAQMDFLARCDLDVLLLQEAKNWDRDRFTRMQATANALGMQALFAPSNSHGCHLVTLYRWPKVRCHAYEADMAEGTFHHAASRARFSLGEDSAAFHVINTHLDPFSGEDRLAEAVWLTEFGGAGHRTVLGGDLNTEGLHDPEPPGDWSHLPEHLHSRHRLMLPDGTWGASDRRAIGALTAAGFVDPAEQLGLTPPPRTAGYWSPDELWDHRSDFVLLGTDLAPGLVAHEVVDTAETRALSDHLPVVVTLDLAKTR